MKGKTIVLGVCGGIAAYKACDIVRKIRERQGDVHVILTKAAQQFVTPLTLQTLSLHPVHTDLFSLTEEQQIGHIALADKADLIVIAPATADIIARIAHGHCDDLLTTVICATQAPIVMCPSMNVHMWDNAITRENVKKLTGLGFHILEPEIGDLACGTVGKGRLTEPEKIVAELEKLLSSRLREIK